MLYTYFHLAHFYFYLALSSVCGYFYLARTYFYLAETYFYLAETYLQLAKTYFLLAFKYYSLSQQLDLKRFMVKKNSVQVSIFQYFNFRIRKKNNKL